MEAIGGKKTFLYICLYLLFSYNKRPLIIIRLSKKKGIISTILKWYLRNKYMIEVSCDQIGSHLRLPHPRGIILCAESIGSNCLIGQFVTIGGNNCKKRIENNKYTQVSQVLK